MGNCCDSIQDCCRDICGCCPCNCCKTVPLEIQVEQTIEQIHEKKLLPSGYGFIHAGVRDKNNQYTCPVLEIHLWRKSIQQTTINQANMTQRMALGGRQTQRDNADRHLGSFRGGQQRNIDIEEEVLIIPIDSIFDIKYSSEVKKGETEYQNVRFRTPSPRRKRCCCCKTKNKHSNKQEEIITTISNQTAERKILMTIEYSRYHHIHVPSHVQVLNQADQYKFFHEKFHIDTIQFYLLDNQIFDQTNFQFKQMQASILCRSVIQIKAMNQQNYPDEIALEQILGQTNTLTIGEQVQETIGEVIQPSSSITMSLLTIETTKF